MTAQQETQAALSWVHVIDMSNMAEDHDSVVWEAFELEKYPPGHTVVIRPGNNVPGVIDPAPWEEGGRELHRNVGKIVDQLRLASRRGLKLVFECSHEVARGWWENILEDLEG